MFNLPTGTITFLFSDIEESLTLRGELGDKRGIALSLAGLGGVAVALGSARPGSGGESSEIERGARAVEALLESIGPVLDIEDRHPYERVVAKAIPLLGPDKFARLRAEGRAMSLEQAVDYALQEN